MREKYESLSLATLKDLAKARGLKGISGLKKAELIERMLEEDEKDKQKTQAGAPKGERHERPEQHRQDGHRKNAGSNVNTGQVKLTEDNVKELSANTGDREIQTEFWRLCRTATALSGVRTICRETTMCTCRPPRSAGLI